MYPRGAPSPNTGLAGFHVSKGQSPMYRLTDTPAHQVSFANPPIRISFTRDILYRMWWSAMPSPSLPTRGGNADLHPFVENPALPPASTDAVAVHARCGQRNRGRREHAHDAAPPEDVLMKFQERGEQRHGGRVITSARREGQPQWD